MTTGAHDSGWRARALFFGRFLRNPRSVGAIAPSSAALAAAMVEAIDFSRARSLVELGPGTGAFTATIAGRLSPPARLLAIDREAMFVERLQGRWPNVECVTASAADLPHLAAERGLLPIDHIISGLPFASLPAAVTVSILDAVEQTLRPGGTFTTFQYVHAYRLPPAVTFRREIDGRLGGPPSCRLVVGNLPPAYVLTWSRGAGRE
jgi:phospholipid N-methyltransferase